MAVVIGARARGTPSGGRRAASRNDHGGRWVARTLRRRSRALGATGNPGTGCVHIRACRPPRSSERSGVPAAPTPSTSAVARADLSVSARPRHHWRTPCCCTPPPRSSSGDLTALTRDVAAEVRSGRHEVQVDPERRWYRLLRSDEYVDVWLISWATEQTAELHDHAGSLGALTVVSGSLVEKRWVGPRPARAARDRRAQPRLSARDTCTTSGTPRRRPRCRCTPTRRR